MTVTGEAVRYRLMPSERRTLESEVLAVWEREDLFRQTITASAGRPEWVFYEGPPTANGRPGMATLRSTPGRKSSGARACAGFSRTLLLPS